MEPLKLSPMLYFLNLELWLRAAHGEWGILKKIPVNADYNKLIYDQTVLSMDYLDCSPQTLSLIDFKLKDHTGKVVNLHGGHVSFSIIFVKVADE